MKTVAWWLVVAWSLVVMGCASNTENHYPPSGDASPSVRDAGAAKGDGAPSMDAAAPVVSDGGVNDAAPAGDAGPTDAPPPFCALTVRAANAADLSNVPAGPNDFLILRAVFTGTLIPSDPDWQWQVTTGGQAVATTVEGLNPTLIRVPTIRPGLYTVTARATPDCQAQINIRAVLRNRRETSFFVRVIPPSEAGLSPLDEKISAVAGTPVTRTIQLPAGTPVQLDPRTSTLAASPSYMRLSTNGSTFLFEGESTTAAPLFLTLPLATYDLLVVPQSTQAPLLFRNQTPSSLRLLDLVVNAGTAVTGTLLQDDSPVVGGRILLRNGALPSTLGLSQSGGAFALQARPGTHEVEVLPPQGSPLPRLFLPASRGVVIGPQTPASIKVIWITPQVRKVDLLVTDAQSAPVAGARVTMRPQSVLPMAGQIALNNGVPQAADGTIEFEGSTNGQGTLQFAAVPAGIYNVQVDPRSTAVGDRVGRVSTAFDVRAGGAAQTIVLINKITLSGQLNPPALGANATVVGIANDTSDRVTTTTADATGHFQLKVDGQSAYRLFADPPAARANTQPRASLGVFESGSADSAVTLPTIPAGLLFNGTVISPQGAPVRNAILQVFCMGTTPGCIDHSNPSVNGARPLVESRSNGLGAFSTVVPDPGIE